MVAASAGGRVVAEDDANLANDDDEYENDDDADDGWPVRLVAAAAWKDPTGGRVERVENADTSIDDDEVRRVRESTMVNIMVAAKIIMVDAAPLVPIVIVFSLRDERALRPGKNTGCRHITPMKKKIPGI